MVGIIPLCWSRSTVGAYDQNGYYISYYVYDSSKLFLLMAAIFFVPVAYLIPCVMRARYLKKRNADIYFSLPVSRKGLFINDSLFGLSLLLAIFLFSYMFGGIFTFFFKDNSLTAASYFINLGIDVSILIIAYAFSLGVSCFCNNTIDLFIVNALALLSSAVIYGFIATNGSYTFLSASFGAGEPITHYSPFGILTFMSGESTYFVIQANRAPFFDIMLIPHLVFSIFLVVMGYFHSIKWKSEQAGDKSTSFMAYPLWISMFFLPLYAMISSTLRIDYLSNVFYILMIVATLFYVVIDFVSKRKIKITWQGSTILLINILVGLGIGALTYGICH
jgi:hypothetical protein